MARDRVPVGDCNTRGFLSAVLKRVKGEIRLSRDALSGRVNTDDPARLVQRVAGRKGSLRIVGSCHRRGASSSASCGEWRPKARSAAAASWRASSGEQFALPEALDALRAIRRSSGSEELPDVPSVDPLHALVAVSPPVAPPASIALST